MLLRTSVTSGSRGRSDDAGGCQLSSWCPWQCCLVSESSLAGARESLQIKPQNQKEEGCEAILEQSETSQNYKVQGGVGSPLMALNVEGTRMLQRRCVGI